MAHGTRMNQEDAKRSSECEIFVMVGFEKSLYDLIRGLRNHKGNEKEYIQNSLKECRVEIRGKDMDVKATALLKLIYLEMFGHDMSWAAFHVLEVMSSGKYLQKRVGYLGAVQSFRSDTEVLMLATNLLKKDLVSASIITMSLPIITLPHIITSSLALSVLSDLLPRLTHSSPAIRKKTIVTLYRLALCYPETLRAAWPKIKERLVDEQEDSSVTAAIVNVICELGWRRPQDFLPLAPRLFELLVDSGNNWMAIKLIKLFATLTPLEPRLVKKLLPPLTSIIRTTPAMSLLYECINGIIQGGILDGADGSVGGDEIASLCVSKLRGMIMVEGDPNLRYVALLAFNKIVLTHPYLVAQQEDVIMDCLDSADISIRLRALDLVSGMVSIDNLTTVIGRLMRQLRNPVTSSLPVGSKIVGDITSGIDPTADSDDETPEINIKMTGKGTDPIPLLPDEYRIDVISRIIDMCAANNYSNLLDFDWYIDILLQLIRNAPIPNPTHLIPADPSNSRELVALDISEKVGDELRNIAVKAKDVRATASRAAESLILASYTGDLSQSSTGKGALRPVAWVAGEYASYLSSPADVLTALLQIAKSSSSPGCLAIYLQAIPKIFALLTGDDRVGWTPERKTMTSLLMARIIHTLEPLASHPDLEVQERAVEFAEVLKLAAEASAGQESSANPDHHDTPLLLTQVIPSLFTGLELNSVAAGAQRNVPIPGALDLERPINSRLNELLQSVGATLPSELDHDEFEVYYHQGPTTIFAEPAVNRLTASNEDVISSYQQGSEESYPNPDIIARRLAERRERNKDDPYYIAGTDHTAVPTPLDNIIQSENDDNLDIDSIPIIQLDFGQTSTLLNSSQPRKAASKPRQLIQVAADETLSTSGTSTPKHNDSEPSMDGTAKIRSSKTKNSLLLVDSSSIGAFSLEGDGNGTPGSDHERQQQEDAEMAKAMQEVERLRLEMQRANERIQAVQGVPPEGTLVKKKAKKKVKPVLGEDTPAEPRKKRVEKTEKPAQSTEGADVTTPIKKHKKRSARVDERENIITENGRVDS